MTHADVYDRSFTAGDHAAGLDECADALNYATRWIRNPGEVDRVAANLSSTVAKFPLAFGSIKDWLQAESAAGRLVDVSDPETTLDAVSAAGSALDEAILAAWELHSRLEQLHALVAGLAVVGPTLPMVPAQS
jgi:hypothetical protein